MSAESIYLVEGDTGLAEMERAIGISVMGVEEMGGSVFFVDVGGGKGVLDLAKFKKSWIAWLQQSFRDHLAEVFVDVYTAASEMRIKRVIQLDKELDQVLSESEAKRSKLAGECFLQGKSEMQRAPQWQKYASAIEGGDGPGHVLTVFALQSALYHLPLLSALTAYVYFEWRAAIGDQAKGKVTLADFEREHPESIKIVREVFTQGSEFATAASAM